MEHSNINSYAGDLNPQDVWLILKTQPDSSLIDVRTEEEIQFIWEPVLNKLNKFVKSIPWVTFPEYKINPNFIEQLHIVVPNKKVALFFICKADSRSRAAAIAATRDGYSLSYSVAKGFEGDLNKNGQRGTTSGWKAENLPWVQN